MSSPPAGSLPGSQPSLEPLREDEHGNTDQDHEANRVIGPGETVPLGKLVDKLPKTAEIDQKFDADDIDEREDQTEPQSDEDGRQRGGKQNLPELLGGAQIEALSDVDQHAPRGQKAFRSLKDDRRNSGGEAHHHNSQGAPAEDHQIERIHQNERR